MIAHRSRLLAVVSASSPGSAIAVAISPSSCISKRARIAESEARSPWFQGEVAGLHMAVSHRVFDLDQYLDGMLDHYAN